MRLRKRPCAIERLERRDLFAAQVAPWPEIDSLRISFVPDGTQVGDSRNELFRMLNSTLPNVDWQLEMLTAFQTWAIETNSNVGLVEDQGQPIGTIGFKQGDLRFGDVRLGAFPMEQDVLAVANPYDPFIANTWVGDVFLNSSTDFLSNAKDQARSLLSVMLHEAGHVFGVGHSTDTKSPMYPYLQDPITALAADDIAKLQSISGPRESDRWEGDLGNESIADATSLLLVGKSGQRVAAELTADVSSSNDVDTYAFAVSQDTDFITVDLHASGKSLLMANVTVLNERGEQVASRVALDPRDNDLSLTIEDVEAGQRYFVQVRSANESVFGIGRYALEVAPHAVNDSTLPAKTVLELIDLPGFASEELMVTTPGYVEHTYYELAGTLTNAKASQTFRFHSPILNEQLTNVFTIILTAETGSIDNLGLVVTDASGTQVPMTLISEQNGKLELQVVGVKADVDFLATVYAKDLSKLEQVYELEVDFAHDGRQLQTLVTGSLSDTQTVYSSPLTIDVSGHYHFVVSGSDWSDPHESGLTMQVRDATGQTVASVDVVDGGSEWFDLFLNRGQYSVEFSSPSRLADVSMLFQLAMESESSPIGPQLRDMSSKPVERVAAPPIDALIARWLPGYGNEKQAFVLDLPSGAHATSVADQRTPNAGVVNGDSRNYENIGKVAYKPERTKPKKLDLKATPSDDTSTIEPSTGIRLAPAQQAEQFMGSEQVMDSEQPSPSVSAQLEPLYSDAASLVSSHSSGAVQDQVIAAGWDKDETSDATASETKQASILPQSVVGAFLAGMFALTVYRRHRPAVSGPQTEIASVSFAARKRRWLRSEFF